MSILVTGSSGFIASHLIPELPLNHGVIMIDRKSGLDINKVNSYCLDEIFSTGIETVYHLAANSDISTGDPQIEIDDTLKTTLRLLYYCRLHKVKKFVFASSSAVYGDTTDMITENHQTIPISHYGAAKLASEAFLCSYAANYGIQVYLLRFPNVIGDNATHGILYDLIRKIKANPDELEVLGNGEQIKPYIHVSELVEAIQFIVNKANDLVNIYNISGIGRTTVKEIAEMVVKKAGGTVKIKYTGGASGWVGDCPHYIFNIEKLLNLGWIPKGESNLAIEQAINEIWEQL